MNIFALVLFLFCALAVAAHAQQEYSFPVRTRVANGMLEGNYDTRSGLQIFLGIPFAKPPTGNLRWRAPEPPENWEGVRPAGSFAHRPVQGMVFGDMRFRSPGLSEDCLYLNVWTPARRNTKGLPVLVYLYGGGFVAGDGSEPRYDGASMAKKGIVVVTCNYRLNIFGFLAHPELSAESPLRTSGNYGLLDQYAAMKWVHENIAAFGGDPSRITIAGESAGSVSVSVHMASPWSKPLIAGAIGQSGAAIHPTLAPVSLAEAEQTGLEFARKAGYESVAELRELSTLEVYEIYQESGRFGFPLVIDGNFLPAPLPEVFRVGHQAQVPLLLGWNSAEIPGMAFMQGLPYTEENYILKVKNAYPDDFSEVLKLYPHGSPAEIEWSATALASDSFIAYSTWKWFDLHRKHSRQRVYRYLYSKLRPPLVDAGMQSGLAGGAMLRQEGSPPPPEPIGAPHACEIEYCLGNLYLVSDYDWTPEDYAVSAVMREYFANFIARGNPNGNGLPEWPAAPAEDECPPVMVMDLQSGMERALRDTRYEFLDKWYGND